MSLQISYSLTCKLLIGGFDHNFTFLVNLLFHDYDVKVFPHPQIGANAIFDDTGSMVKVKKYNVFVEIFLFIH